MNKHETFLLASHPKRTLKDKDSFKTLQKLALTRECQFSAHCPGVHVFLLGKVHSNPAADEAPTSR